MNTSIALFRTGALLALLLATPAQAQQGPKVADAKPGEVRMMVTAAIKGPLDAVLDQARQALGKPIVVEYGSARGNLKEEILAGQEFEVALLLPDVDEELLKAGKIMAGSQEIARVDVAVGIRGDVSSVDIGTPEKLKSAMLKAKSIKYAPTGAAIMTVRKVLSTLAIADQIKDSSKERAPVALGAGEYELNFYPLSEILANKNLRNLGPVTKELQVPAIVTATVGSKAKDEKTARALIKFLQGNTIDAALKVNGMKKGETAG